MIKSSFNKYLKIRMIIVLSIVFILAAIHMFRVGSYLSGKWYILYYSFASDIMLPFGAYFLLSMSEINLRFLQKWYIKAGIVFGAATFCEIMQYFGINFLGVTFDMIDIVMFGAGISIAVLVDKFIFERFVPSWKYLS